MTKSLITLLLLASSAAFANEAADEMMNRAASSGSATRAEVRAEIAAARQQDTLNPGEYAQNLPKASTAQRSRIEVRFEAIEAARAHPVFEQM